MGWSARSRGTGIPWLCRGSCGADLQAIVDEINDTPMKALGRETPNEDWYRELGKVMSRTSHPRTSVALSIRQRDLMIYQQVRRIDELERRISELQLELKQREGQQG